MIDEVTVGTIADTPAPDAHMSDEALLDQTLAANAAAAPVDETPAEDADEPEESVEDAIKAETAKTAPVEEPVKPNGDASKDKENEQSIDDDFTGNLTIHALNAQIAKNAQLKTICDNDPAFKKQLFFTTRRAERADQYDELFQTPALAKETKAAADREYETGSLYEGEDSQKFLESLVSRSYERDEQGRIKLDANNQPVYNGSYDRHMTHYRNAWYGSVENAAKNLADGHMITIGAEQFSKEDILEATKILRAVTENKSPAQSNAAISKDLPPDVQARLAELESLKASQKSTNEQSLESFRTNVNDERDKAIEASVRGLLNNKLPKDNALPDYFKDTIVADTVKSIKALAEKNMAHRDVINRAIKGASRDAEGVKRVVAIHAAYAKDLLGRELARVLSKATPTVVAAASAARGKVTQQSNRREVQASGGVSSPTRPDGKQLARTIEAEARKSGKRLSDEEFLDQAVAAQQRG